MQLLIIIRLEDRHLPYFRRGKPRRLLTEKNSSLKVGFPKYIDVHFK